MSDYGKLRSAIDADPALTAKAQAGEWQAVASGLTAKSAAGKRYVTIQEAYNYLVSLNKWAAISRIAQRVQALPESLPEPHRGPVQDLIETLEYTVAHPTLVAELNPDNDTNAQVAQALGAAGILTPAEAAGLIGLSVIPVTAEDAEQAWQWGECEARAQETADVAAAAQQAMERYLRWRDRYVSQGDCPAPPVVAGVDAPDGFEWDAMTGAMVPVVEGG